MRIIALFILTFWALYANAQRDIFLVTTNNELYTFNPGTCQANRIGVIQQAGGEILDIAVCPNGNMYALTLTQLHQINAGNASIISSKQLTGSIAGSSPNALTCDLQNRLYAAAFFRTNLYSINPDNGQSTVLGNMGYSSAGDLSILDDNTLLLTTHANQLVRVNKADGQASPLTTINANTTIYGTISIPNQDCANGNVDLIAFGGTDVYKVNSQSLGASLICSGIVPAIVTGAASLAEINATPSSIQTSVSHQICQPGSVDLTQFLQGQRAGGQFTASQNGHLLSGSTARFEPNTPPGDYLFTYRAGTGNCIDEASIRITYSYINVNLGGSLQVCQGSSKTIGITPLPGNYAYSWNTGASSPTLTINESGTYTLSIRYGACNYAGSVTVNVAPIQLTDILLTMPHCNKNDGVISANAQGGSQFTYQLNNQPVQSTARFDNLGIGQYTLTARNGEGCIMVKTVELMPDAMPSIKSVDRTQPTCGLPNGQLLVSATGGTGDLLYSLDGKTFQKDPAFKNLHGGTFQLLVKDQEDCQATQPVDLAAKPAPAIETVDMTASTCGFANGALTVRASGGYGQLFYSLDGKQFQPDNIFRNLMGGAFRIYIKDQDQCQSAKDISLIAKPIPQIEAIQLTPPTCGRANGQIQLRVKGGSGAIQYSLDGKFFQPENVFASLGGGTFNLSIKDQDGCVDGKEVSLQPKSVFTLESIQSTPPSCGLANGKLTVQVKGGSEQLFYSLDGRSFQSENSFTNLQGGDFQVYVQDKDGCQTIQPVSLPAKPILVIETVSMASPTCGLANGNVKIQARGGTGELWYSLDGKNYQLDNTFRNLQGGSFHACVKDQDNCLTEQPVDVPKSLPLQLTNLKISPATCNKPNGSIQWQITGGDGNVRYSLNDQSMPKTGVKDLKAGTYTLVAVDGLGCTDRHELTIPAIAPPSIIRITATPTLCDQQNGEFLVQAEGSQPLLYSANGNSFQPQASLTHLDEGKYTIVVKDAYQCTVSQESTIAMHCTNTVYRPTAFSPNHDGINDIFDIKFPFKQLKLIRFAIYNRWGNPIHANQNRVLHSGDSLWDGQIDGIAAQPDVYSYILEIAFPDGQTHQFTGTVTILN